MRPNATNPDLIPETARLGIVCEGRHEERFLKAFFAARMPKLDAAKRIYIASAVGNSQIGKRLQSLKNARGLSNLTHLAVVRDAETDVHGACQSVRSAFSKAGFCFVPTNPGIWYSPTPEDLKTHPEWRELCTGYLLFPTCDSEPCAGTLEDLATSTLAGQEADECLRLAQAYLDATREKRHIDRYKEPHKNLFYAYLAGTDNIKGCKIGEAAAANCFDWEAPEYQFMTDFFMRAFQ